MRILIHTQTGSVHEVDTSAKTYRRREWQHGMRRDGEELPMHGCILGPVGHPVMLWLQLRPEGEPLSLRTTSPVVRYEEAL